MLQFGEYRYSGKRRLSLLLQEQTIFSLKDLQPFFARLMIPFSDAPLHKSSLIQQAELVIDNDFIEPTT